MQTLVSTRPAAEQGVKSRGAGLRKSLTVIAFLLPPLIMYVVFVLYPIIQAAYYSMFKWKGLGPLTNNVGLQNFRDILNDEVFRMAVQHNLTIVALSLLIQLPLALFVALLIRNNLFGRTFFRTVFFLPFVLSEIVTGLVWTFLLRADGGLVNIVIGAIVPGYTPRGWLGDTDTVLYAVIGVITWKFFGFHMILYLAGLQAIPPELEDAARVDGATRIRVIRDITVPLLLPTIKVSIFFSVLGSLQFFDLIWIMTKGGPVNASNTMATYLYTYGFQRFQLGYGAAISLVIFAICFIFSITYQNFVMRRDYAGAIN